MTLSPSIPVPTFADHHLNGCFAPFRRPQWRQGTKAQQTDHLPRVENLKLSRHRRTRVDGRGPPGEHDGLRDHGSQGGTGHGAHRLHQCQHL